MIYTNKYMIYKCINCNYETSRSNNYKKHILSIKHKKSIFNSNNNNLTNMCLYCNTVFKYKSGLCKHLKNCNKKEIHDKLKNANQIINQNNTLINQSNIIHKEIKNVKTTVDDMKITMDDVKFTVDDVKTSVNNVIKKTSSLIKYLMKNYNNVQPLVQFTEDKCKKIIDTAYGINNQIIKQNKSDTEILLERLIFDYKKKQLHSYIGNLIYKILSDKDKNKQPIWTSDVSRLNYAIKITLDKWHNDHVGHTFCDLVINPISDYLIKIITEWQRYFYDIEEDIYDINLWNKLADSVDVKSYIKSEIFMRDILKLLAPKFKFIKEELNIITNLINIEKYKHIIFDNNINDDIDDDKIFNIQQKNHTKVEEKPKKKIKQKKYNNDIINNSLDSDIDSDIHNNIFNNQDLDNPYINGYSTSDDEYDNTPYNNYAFFRKNLFKI